MPGERPFLKGEKEGDSHANSSTTPERKRGFFGKVGGFFKGLFGF